MSKVLDEPGNLWRKRAVTVHPAVEQVVAAGDFVAERWTWTGRRRDRLLGNALANKRFSAGGTAFFRMQAGKIAEQWRVECDLFGMLRHYGDRPLAASLEALHAARATSAEIVERLSEAEWVSEGTHTESGRSTVEDWLEIYAAHAHDHAGQIRRARAAAGR